MTLKEYEAQLALGTIDKVVEIHHEDGGDAGWEEYRLVLSVGPDIWIENSEFDKFSKELKKVTTDTGHINLPFDMLFKECVDTCGRLVAFDVELVKVWPGLYKENEK